MSMDWVTSPWFVSAIGGMVAFKVWMKYTTGKYEGQERLTGKTVIVTGANSGVGLEAAKDFASRGARVIMVCRDMKKAEFVKKIIINETANTDIVLKHINFESLTTVRECAQEILREENQINILLNNAGTATGCCTKSEDGLDLLMQSNHFGPFLFTNILLGCIKSSAPSRILNVSSEVHKMAKLNLACSDLSDTKNSSVAYGNSKLCNILMANELADKLKGTGVTVNSLTPGVVLTEILRDVTPWFRIPWNFLIKIFLKNSKEGAQTSIFACVSPEIADVTGRYFMDCKLSNTSETAKDNSISKKVWKLSEEAVGLKQSEKHY
ncbi:retinol dehydrogenase 14-like isoform X2 [Arctopsyche grandis]